MNPLCRKFELKHERKPDFSFVSVHFCFWIKPDSCLCGLHCLARPINSVLNGPPRVSRRPISGGKCGTGRYISFGCVNFHRLFSLFLFSPGTRNIHETWYAVLAEFFTRFQFCHFRFLIRFPSVSPESGVWILFHACFPGFLWILIRICAKHKGIATCPRCKSSYSPKNVMCAEKIKFTHSTVNVPSAFLLLL